MKNVVIVHASAGVGHTKAALAVYDALKKHSNHFSCEVVDILDFTNPGLRWTYQRLYILIIKYVPLLWAMVYYILDIPLVFACLRNLRTFLNRFNTGKFADYLKRVEPDWVISTHFFSSEVVATLKRRHELTTQLVTIITDFRSHTFWIAPDTDRYVVACDSLKQELIAAGVEECRIAALGIPVELTFHESPDKDALCEKLNIQKGIFTVLIASGGYGVGPVSSLVQALAASGASAQLLIVCGRNEALYNEMKQFAQNPRNPLHVYGFVDNMYELMSVADVLVSKSGGMTVSEALAKDLPMIIIRPVPGQEMRNCQFLVDRGAAVRADEPAKVAARIIELTRSDTALKEMKARIKDIKKPRPSASLREALLST